MKLFQKLKLDARVVDVVAESEWFKTIEQPTAFELENNLESFKHSIPFSRNLLAFKAYYIEDSRLAKLHWEQVPLDTLEYFFGDWRNTFKFEKSGGDPNYWKRREWMGSYNDGLLACAITGKWDVAKQLSEYPDEKCGQDVDTQPEERSYLLALSEWLRTGVLESEGKKHLESAKSGKSPRAKEEAKLLEVAIMADEKSAKKIFSDYMAYYLKKVFPLRDVTEKQSKMGTFFWHRWKKSGIDIDLDSKHRDYIIRLT